MKKNILIFGQNGQVASNLIRLFKLEENFVVTAVSSLEADFSNILALENFLENLEIIPNFIINAAAYTNVDKAEDEKELCDAINHQAVAALAKFCAKKNITLIHFSTDYVFNGFGALPLKASDQQNLIPLNYYGKTKLLAELAIQASKCNYIIFRVSWVYDDKNSNAKNFYNTITKLAKEKEVLTIINDQVGSPTKADFIALNVIKVIKRITNQEQNLLNKIYHLNNGRFISWYDFAQEIVDELRKKGEVLKVKEIKPIKTVEYKTRAVRPLNSRLYPSFISLVKFRIVKIYLDIFIAKIKRKLQKKIHKISLKYLKINKKDAAKLLQIEREFPEIISLNKTVDMLVNGASMSRFGDGEFNIANFISLNNGYQECSNQLTQRLNEVISQPISEKFIVCISPFKSPKHCKNWYRNLPYWEFYWLNHWNLVKNMIKQKKYGNALVSRDAVFYEVALDKIKSIWHNKDVVFVVGKGGRFVFDERLFGNIKSSNFIYVSPKNAFEDYENILANCLKFSRDKLFFIAAGPTATVLAFDLYKAGYQALDFGHLPNCYAEFLQEKPAPEAIRIDNLS